MRKTFGVAMFMLAAAAWLLNGFDKKSSQAEAAQPAKEMTLDLGDKVTLKLVLIPEGAFVMGSPETEWGHSQDEEPLRRVKITKPFYVGVTEVTQEQYTAVMGNNPSNFSGMTNPVDQVDWDHAVAFCKKLSEKTGKTVRLPTEAEWEYACRAGNTTKFGFGGDDKELDDYAWHKGNSDKKSHPVGQKKPNAWGLYDMHGNVSEWCSDWYQRSYQELSVSDPTGPATGTLRVRRGGYWGGVPGDCRSATRVGVLPGNDHKSSGLRVVVAAGVD